MNIDHQEQLRHALKATIDALVERGRPDVADELREACSGLPGAEQFSDLPSRLSTATGPAAVDIAARIIAAKRQNEQKEG